MTERLRAAIYVRVSTDSQRIAMQVDEAKALVAERGWELVAVFEDLGEAGGTPFRPGLTAVRSAARSGGMDVLVVWRMDRLFRSMLDMLALVDELLTRGVQIVSCTEPIDLATAAGRLQLKLAAAFAEYEREVSRERTCSVTHRRLTYSRAGRGSGTRVGGGRDGKGRHAPLAPMDGGRGARSSRGAGADRRERGRVRTA